MSDRRLYTLRIAERALQDTPGSKRQALQNLKALESNGSTTPTGQQPGTIRLDGQFGDDLAELLGAEFRELLSAAQYNYLEYYFVANATGDGVHPDAGYYASEETRGGRVVPKTSGVVSFDVSLTREGTRRTHHRRIRTSPKQRPHQWGTATDALVGIPAAARRVRWLDSEGTKATAASPTTTDTTEYGDVDLYRADTAPYNNPQLTYDLDYFDAGNVDTRLYDTWRNSKIDSEGRFAWQQVYTTSHEYRGDIVLKNGLIRLTINPTPDPHTLAVAEYSGGSWSDTTLGTSDWRLAEIDLRRIAPTAVRARTEWVDTAGSAEHTLDMVLPRGFDAVQFFEPTDGDGNQVQASQAPQGLVDYLDPIASSNRIDPDGQQGLIERTKLPVGGAGSGSGGSETGYGTEYGIEYGVL